jgi:hypothetical protein
MATGDPKASGFTINDRRAFTDGGDPRQDEQVGQVGQVGEDEQVGQVAQDRPGGQGAKDAGDASGGLPTATEEPSGAFPAVDFHTFVLSLGSSALLHLGELEHPDVGAPQIDLGLAKQTIDILAMLEQKTKGNLTSAEAKLIESLLYDLRLRFVEASKAKPQLK